MKEYKIKEETVNNIAGYLGRCQYTDVAGLINELSKIEEIKPEVIPEKKK